jgi:hypothetical protein
MQERPFTDEELDAYILLRLRSLGVDLSVLPEDDRAAPTDRRRILDSARRFLRTTPAAIHRFAIDPQEFPPVLYAGLLPAQTRER